MLDGAGGTAVREVLPAAAGDSPSVRGRGAVRRVHASQVAGNVPRSAYARGGDRCAASVLRAGVLSQVLADDAPRTIEDVPQPLHGEVRQYWRGCRCLPCRVALSRWRAENRKRELAEMAPAREHLARLARQGVGTPQV